MEKKDAQKYKEFDSSSDTSSVGSDESLEQVTGPNFADFARQLTFKNGNEGNSYYFPYDQVKKEEKEGTYEFPTTFTEKKEPPKSTDVTTLFLIDSLNRDRVAFPQPTNLTLKLPRTYKNVKSISLTQVKLLCSFYYFSDSNGKSNIYLPIIERGRESVTTLNRVPLTKNISIRQGTYGINDLLTEIQTVMNFTPLFYDFPNGFTDFIQIFTVSGDFSINFNQPGDTYYDSLNNKYIQNPTFATIISYYWGTRYAGLPDYSMDQFKVAYYYPVLYEVFLDEIDIIAYPNVKNTVVPANLLGPGESVYSHLIFNMSGINDKVALYLINQNIIQLDKYRETHTFRSSLVNRYQLAYDTNSLQVNITTTTLNTSLVNLINNTSASALTSILTSLGLTATTYAALQNTANKATVVYTGMFQFLQKQLTIFAGISFATYAPQFFNNTANIIYFQNGLNALGVRTEYTLEYLTSGEIPLVSTLTNLTNSPRYWPNMITSLGYQGTDLTTINSPDSIIPYNIPGKNFQFGNSLIDTTKYFFNTNKASRSVDAVVNILPAQYSIFKFRSSARQTLQVETLPLPYYYRYSDYNKQGLYKGVLDLSKNNVPKEYFDISYNFLYNSINNTMDSLKYKPNILQPIFGQSFQDSFIIGTTLKANSQTNYTQFEFTAPYPTAVPSGLCATNTSISFVSMLSGNLSTLFPDSFSAFVYHDRAAFMADLEFSRKENPLHFIHAISTNSSKSDMTIHFSTFSGHKYYTIFRSDNLACSNTFYRPVLYNENSSYVEIKTDYLKFDPNANPYAQSNITNYPFVTNYNPDFTRLPTRSSLMAKDPNSSSFNVVLQLQGIPIGYDISGVSNDLTDYMGYNSGSPGFDPNTQIRIDPLSYYNFQYNSPFNQVSTTYFDSKSLNSLLEPVTNNTYSFKVGASTSQIKIVHWYDGFSIPKQLDDPFTTLKTINIAETSSMATYIKSYPVNSSGDIVLGRGINAIGFLPNDGLFDVNSFSFKSCIYPLTATSATQEDPNLQIEYIGVFSGLSLVNSLITLSSALTILKFQNSIPYGPNTLSNTPGFGFELGTWYTYDKDPGFVPTSNAKISGYTPNSNELLSYNSMYYMVPFSANGANLTYSALSGSLLAYPLSYNVSTSPTFYGQIAQNTPGAPIQKEYIIPIKKFDSSSEYEPQGIYSPIQSQYARSIPITTTSLGYKEYSNLANDINAPFVFSTLISTTPSSITTFFSEYSDNVYLVTTSSMNCSNAMMSYPSASYASSLSTAIEFNGTTDCMKYLLSPPSTLQDYQISGTVFNFSTFTFQSQAGDDSNITMRSVELNSSMDTVTMWLWGGGGGTWSNTTNISGGAGAYAKVNINVQNLLATKTADCPRGISTLYMVVGKGGNRDNFSFVDTVGSLQLYEQPRYGGGGTSILGNFIDGNSIGLQGGGFSGLFTGSNLLSTTALLIVGGGGAAGATELGGPGGFGVTPPLLPILDYTFSTATFGGLFYNRFPVSNAKDPFSNPILNGSTISNIIDTNLNTFWNPSFPAKMNPQNYNPSPNRFALNLEFSSIPTSISKIRYYGPPVSNTVNLPTGFLLYNDMNKAQLLYSNTSIQKSDFQIINNGTSLQQTFEFIPTTQVVPSTISTFGWLVAGTNLTSHASIQYSLNKSTWVPTQNSLLTNITSIQYISHFSKWYASGQIIIESVNAMQWTPCQVTGFNGTLFNTIAFGLGKLIAGANDGSLFVSRDGHSWTYTGTKFSTNVNRVRFVNGIFWALGGSDIAVKKSLDGIIWTNVIGISNMNIFTKIVIKTIVNDITYALGRYIIVQNNGVTVSPSGILFSSDGMTWSPVSQVNLTGFTGLSVVYAASVFVAVGKTLDETSFIKYSLDGINWLNSKHPSTGDIQRDDIRYLGNTFVSVGKPKKGTGLAGNQVSIVTSDDAINWSYTFSGGFDPDLGTTDIRAASAGYGPINILPNLSTLYLEIQAELNEPLVYEIRAYDTVTPITANTTALIDKDVNTIFYPSEATTTDVLQYPFILSLATTVANLNKLQIYTQPNESSRFTGISIDLDGSSQSIIYNDMNVTSFQQVAGGKGLYEIIFIPELYNISTLNLTFTKNTPGSLQIADINAIYDPNMTVVQETISSLIDIDKRPPFRLVYGLSNIIDNDNSTYWHPGNFITGDFLRLNISFSTVIDRINRIQIYNGPFPSVQANQITSIGIYTDSNKSIQIYSNANPVFRQYRSTSLLDFDILPILGYSSLYIELGKTTMGTPLINEIKLYNVGTIRGTVNGYSAGNTVSMSRTSYAVNPYNGGGGSSNIGGYGGPSAYIGDKFVGGSPAILNQQLTISTTVNIQYGSGGGGGGYYGGGGGGSISQGTQGGGGGGGSGYFHNTGGIFTLLDYDVAKPGINTTIENYISPRSAEQINLVNSNILQQQSIQYGQGGNPSIDAGKGSHGIIIINYDFNFTVNPPLTTPTVMPSFIDGSQLIVYKSPVQYNTEQRILNFSLLEDSIQFTQYANYNWVWYNSFLSLVGCSLTKEFKASSSIPVFPTDTWPHLPLTTFNDLSAILVNVINLFTTGITQPRVTAISSSLTTTFNSFQNIFINGGYSDTSYEQMTELYCLLDYLQNYSNLSNPHAASGRLDRVLGGIPRFGYWANPFFTNVSYIGFDVTNGQIPIPALSTLAQNSKPVQAIYGLVLEQSLSTGVYEFKDIMAYKPTILDSITWHTVTQFNESYAVRSLTSKSTSTTPVYLASNIPVQPYTFRNAIAARLPLFNYSVYTAPTTISSIIYNAPIQIINDFQGSNIYMYSFQNTLVSDISSINISQLPFTSTTLQMNQENINKQEVAKAPIIGTIVSEYANTIVNAVTNFGFNGINYRPVLEYTTGTSNYYNNFSPNTNISSGDVGRAINDVYGNYYFTKNNGGNDIYQNICTLKIFPQAFLNTNINFASPKSVLNSYNAGLNNPYRDFFVSKFTNIWHLPAIANGTLEEPLSNVYGVRLNSPYDFNVNTTFTNQLFYPTHKITLVKIGSLVNPIQNTNDTATPYPSFQHTEMFFYKNYSTMLNDISGCFAQEKTSNFAYSDMSSGYGFNSYIYNINMPVSTDFNNDNADSFNYLAIRAYSPSETFQSLVRFYLPQRYDFGYISLKDLSNEQLVINTISNVNPDYKAYLTLFNQAFSTNDVYGATGVPGFSGSNISTVSFGDFLKQYNNINAVNLKNTAIISTVAGLSNAAITSLITGDLKYILPGYLANRNRTTDPVEFSIPFSSCVTPSNAIIEAYGMGYNLGFEMIDTPFNTVHRATSFFKILDDSIYLRMNEEFGLNKMDISQPENFAQTLETTAQSGRYNSKLILNSFGSFATTFVQSPVTFNPPVGKLDKLSFSWYNAAGVLLNNNDCDWSGSVQIVETVTASAT